MTSGFENQVLTAWESNAASWIDAVSSGEIRAPGSVTREALLAVLEPYLASQLKFLDVGSGEGWLVEMLANRGHDAIGVDSSAALIEHAKKFRKGRFYNANQGSLAALQLGDFELVVCNFSLFGDKPVSDFIASLPFLLKPGGVCVIQTLHPAHFLKESYYSTGWRRGTWAGLPGAFGASPPLFMRTLESWWALFRACGIQIIDLKEPSDTSGIPQSIILTVSPSRN
ncbi:class I SAM-dependent methyltransferase [Marinobacter confluentis]|uniref:Class I SAM-dependent methyltransferase n=1 Tax=Marinobacter confluentis TaxID=1697557 RepID=A0A4Z1CII2_9GAMM|nr:class I SAM-dependent methyltransferase [Marinobacter confluentis]TGN40642.1 class I SAM-dependent methyltransferase [Marinobacter confluentis]